MTLQIPIPPANELEALYAEMSIRAMSEHYHVSFGTVRNWLLAREITLRPSGIQPGHERSAMGKRLGVLTTYVKALAEHYSDAQTEAAIAHAVLGKMRELDLVRRERLPPDPDYGINRPEGTL